MSKVHATAAVLVAALVSSCGGSASDSLATSARPAEDRSAAAPPPTDESPPASGGPVKFDLKAMTERALADASGRSGRAVGELKVVSAEAVVWPDGSLGCAEPGVMYTMALVLGYHIVIEAAAERFDYRASERGQLKLCPAALSARPIPDRSR